ncbi:MAG: FAD-dependent thymidylate synthase [Bacteroidia bacterium]|nr:FAD-dependent thymidylate synthase [Bacteroidia bacterium]
MTTTREKNIVGAEFRVLDDGFIRVVDVMGDDAAVVQAARVSYGAGTKKVSEDRALIRYLMRHRHTSPFEMCEIKFHVRVPMDCWRQWIRHRTASVNEYSTRYSIAIDSAQTTPPDAWRLQSSSNKQGSDGLLDSATGRTLSEVEAEFHRSARSVYEQRLRLGVAREQARKDLPLSTYTEAYWKIDLHNLLRFLELRLHPHAQWEIRSYAKCIHENVLSAWTPMTYEAFNDYILGATTFSAIELKVLAALNAGRTDEALAVFRQAGWDAPKCREREEFEAKADKIGLRLPW